MSTISEYLYSFLYSSDIPKAPPIPKHNKSKKEIFLISPSELLSVNLKPLKDIIPSAARNCPSLNKFVLAELNKAQLKQILNVKLRPSKHLMNKKKRYYIPRHPVLKELLERSKCRLTCTAS